MNSLVVDTSVVVKYFLVEEDTDKATAILTAFVHQDMSLYMPDLLLAEFANVLWKRRTSLTLENAASHIQDLIALDITVVSTKNIIQRAHTIACTTGRTVYDALYIALAEQIGCDMVTADEWLYNAVHKQFPWVKWLREFF